MESSVSPYLSSLPHSAHTQETPPTAPASSIAFPYTIPTAPQNFSQILVRRATALGTSSALLFLIHPFPKLTSLPIPSYNTSLKFPLHHLDRLISVALTVSTLIITYHVSLFEGIIDINHKPVSLKWLIPIFCGIVAFAASGEDTWIKTNVLWDMLGILWVCGWKSMSKQQRRNMWMWVGCIWVGVCVGEIRNVVQR